MILSDAAAERAILAGLCRYGSDAYYDIASLLIPQSFSIDSNEILYKCLTHILEQDHATVIDFPTILSLSKKKGFDLNFFLLEILSIKLLTTGFKVKNLPKYIFSCFLVNKFGSNPSTKFFIIFNGKNL